MPHRGQQRSGLNASSSRGGENPSALNKAHRRARGSVCSNQQGSGHVTHTPTAVPDRLDATPGNCQRNESFDEQVEMDYRLISETTAVSEISDAARLAVEASVLHKTKMCFFYTQGRCQKGEKCAFAHNKKDLVIAPDFSRTKICPTVLAGDKCRDPECRFAHKKSQIRTMRVTAQGKESAPTTWAEALPPGPKAPGTLADRPSQTRGLTFSPDNPQQRQTIGEIETIGTIASVRRFLNQVDERRRASEDELGSTQIDEGLRPFSRQTTAENGYDTHSGRTTTDDFSEAGTWSATTTQDALMTIVEGSRQHTSPFTKQTSPFSRQVTPGTYSGTESHGTSFQTEGTFSRQATPCNDSPGMNFLPERSFSRQATPCDDRRFQSEGPLSRQTTPFNDAPGRTLKPEGSFSRQNTPYNDTPGGTFKPEGRFSQMTYPYNPERAFQPEGPFSRQTTPCNDAAGVAFQPEGCFSKQIAPYNDASGGTFKPEDFLSRNKIPSNDLRGGSFHQEDLFSQQSAYHNEAPVRNSKPNGPSSQHMAPYSDVPGRSFQPQCHFTQQASAHNPEITFNPEDAFVRRTTPYNDTVGRTCGPDGPFSRQTTPFNDIPGRFLQSEGPFSRQTTPYIDAPGGTFKPQGPFSRGSTPYNDAPRRLFQPDATCSPQAFPCGDSPERISQAELSFCRQTTPYVDAAGRFSQPGGAFSQQTSTSPAIRRYNATSNAYTAGLNSSECSSQQAQMKGVPLELSSNSVEASGSQRSVQLVQSFQRCGASTTPSPESEQEEEDSTSSTHSVTEQLSQAAHSRGMQVVVKATFIDFEPLEAPEKRQRKSHSAPPKIA